VTLKKSVLMPFHGNEMNVNQTKSTLNAIEARQQLSKGGNLIISILQEIKFIQGKKIDLSAKAVSQSAANARNVINSP